jgi:hypothetical protein
MGFLYFTEIAATNVISTGTWRHLKNAPPIVLFGLRGPFTLLMPPSLSLALLFSLLPSGLLFSSGSAGARAAGQLKKGFKLWSVKL